MPTRATAALTALAVVVLAACSSHSGSSAAKTTTSTSLKPATTTTTLASGSTTSTTAGPSACTAGDPSGLLPLLPPSLVPTGFTQQADTVGNTGPSDLAKAVKDDGEKDAAAELTKDGFRRGYQRLWSHTDGRDLLAFVYEFCTDGGAQAYAARSARLAHTGNETAFTVSGIPSAIGLTGAADSGATVALVQATAGRYLVVTSADAPKAAATAAQLEALSTGLASKLVAEIKGPDV